MTTPLYLTGRIGPSVAVPIIQNYLYAAPYYPPDICKQYAVHYEEQGRKSGHWRPSGLPQLHPAYRLPRTGRRRIWENPYCPLLSGRHCNPKTFDRLVTPHINHNHVRSLIRSRLDDLAGKLPHSELWEQLNDAMLQDLADEGPILIALDYLEEQGADVSHIRELFRLGAVLKSDLLEKR